MKKINGTLLDHGSLNSSYFYDRVFAMLNLDGVNITYGDFHSRVLANGVIKVLKSLGIYHVTGARDSKSIYVHDKLDFIINTTIASNDVVAKSIIDLVNGEYIHIDKFQINDLSSFFNLDNNYPHSIDLSKCTYIIYNKHNGLYKIGRSSNVFKRLNKLKETINIDLDIVGFLNHDIEGSLHKEYAHKRNVGEWFELTIDDVLDIKNKYNFTILQLLPHDN